MYWSQWIEKGKTIVHYSLELNENYVGLRYDTIFSGITTSNIKYYKDDVKKKLEKLRGKLMIKYYPTKSRISSDIKFTLKTIRITTNKTRYSIG